MRSPTDRRIRVHREPRSTALSGLFSGELLRDVLEDRYLGGIAAVYRHEPAAFAPGLDPAAAIMATVDVQLAAIDWDTPVRVDGVTRDQERIAVVSYPITGNARSLTWGPHHTTARQPARTVRARANRLTIISIRRTLDEETIAAAAQSVRLHVDTNRGHQATELSTWRADTARRVRDAVDARAELIAALFEGAS